MIPTNHAKLNDAHQRTSMLPCSDHALLSQVRVHLGVTKNAIKVKMPSRSAVTTVHHSQAPVASKLCQQGAVTRLSPVVAGLGDLGALEEDLLILPAVWGVLLRAQVGVPGSDGTCR
jgi:hypothetical protein